MSHESYWYDVSFALIAILLVAVGVGLLTMQTDQSQPTSFENLSDQEKKEWLDTKEEQRQNKQSLNRANLYGNPSYCDNITNESLRQQCHEQVTNTD